MASEIKELPKGYIDTPVLPGSKWRVHDLHRPHPPVVTPATVSTRDQVGSAPSDAVVLFDGTSFDAWSNMKGEAVEWKLEDGEMEVVRGARNIRSKESFGNCQLHVEWMAPTEIYADSQGRGNSGVFLMALYEVQVLDGHENPTYADGASAAIYGQHPPLVNACVPPGSWHVFDIVFEAPVYEESNLATPAYMTVFHNGVLVHLRQEMQGPTQHRVLATYAEPHGPKGPLMLQDHGDAVRFRNIWIREIERFSAQ